MLVNDNKGIVISFIIGNTHNFLYPSSYPTVTEKDVEKVIK